MVGGLNFQSHVTFWFCGRATNEKFVSTSAIPMTIKPVRVVTYGWKTPHTRSHYLKLGRVVTGDGGTPPSKSSDLLIMWSYGKWEKTYIYTYTISMTTKLGRAATYIGWNPPTNLRDLLMTWSRDKWKTL